MYHRPYQPTAKTRSQLTPAQQAEAPAIETAAQPGLLTRAAVRSGSPTAQAERLSQASGGRLHRAGQALLQMQREYGNRYVQRVVQHARQAASPAPLIQTKLVLGRAGDLYEQEADRVASQVAGRSRTGQRRGEGEHSEEMPAGQPLHRAEGSAVEPGLQQVIQQARGRGQPLAEQIRRSMEQALGADFSGVRVHNDPRSDQLNRSLKARAFTTGQDIFFRRGEYNSGSSTGQQTLAHELTHVVQQKGDRGTIQLKPKKEKKQGFEDALLLAMIYAEEGRRVEREQRKARREQLKAKREQRKERRARAHTPKTKKARMRRGDNLAELEKNLEDINERSEVSSSPETTGGLQNRYSLFGQMIEQEEQASAATTLQSFIRKANAEKNLAELEQQKREPAATTLQSFIRTYNVEKNLLKHVTRVHEQKNPTPKLKKDVEAFKTGSPQPPAPKQDVAKKKRRTAVEIRAAKPLEILNAAAGEGRISHDGPVESYQYNGHNRNHIYRYTDQEVEIHVHRNRHTGTAEKAHAKTFRMGHIGGTLTTGASDSINVGDLHKYGIPPVQ